MTGCRGRATTFDGEAGADGLDILSDALKAGAGMEGLGLKAVA